MPSETIKRLVTIFESIEADRRLFEPLWKDVSLLVQPSRSTEEDRQRGRDRSIQMYDDTAIVASTRLASFLSSSLTSAALEWFVLQPANAFDVSTNAKFWLEQAQQLLLSIFRLPSSGFNSAINECYIDLASFGTCAMFISGEDFVRFNALPLRECYFAQNHFGRIDTVVRKKLWTADQAADKFGLKNLTDGAKNDWNSTKRYTERREYLHFVLPVEDVRQDKDIQLQVRRNFASIWIDRKEGQQVRIGGFDTFPYAVGRWKVASGEVIGTGPGVEVIDEIRLANAMKKTVIAAASKAADPPLVVDDDTVIGKLLALPGGITYRQVGKTIDQLPVGDPRISDDQLAEVRTFIQAAFFNDIAQLPLQDRMTATEVIERRNDKLQVLSPFATRVQEELLGPIIQRTLALAVQKGAIEPPPDELGGGNISVEYVSPLAISQRSSRLQTVQIWINSVLPFAQIDPDVLLKFNTDEIVEYTGDALNVPPQLVRSDEEVARIKQQRQQLAALQQAAETGRELAETAKAVAEADSIAGRIGVA